MVTSSEDGTVKIWETRSGTIQRSYNHGCPANDVVIHPNQGEIISCDRGGSVRVWDLAENSCSHELIPEEDVSVSSVTVASDGSLLCAANNAVSLECYGGRSPSRERPRGIERALLTGPPCFQGNVFVWKLIQDYETTQLLPVTNFSAHPSYITRVLLSPDVRKLATCSADHTAKIWEVRPLDGPEEDNIEIVPGGYSPPQNNFQQSLMPLLPFGLQPQQNGDNGGPSGRPQIRYKPYKCEATLQGHQRWVWDCAFSADSAYLVTACSDHYARLWELSTQTIIRQYNGHHRGAVCVALNDYSEAR